MSDDTPVMYVNVTGVALDAQTADAIRDAIADALSGDHSCERAIAAEAAIKRVRELHSLYDEHWPHCNRCHEVYPCDTIQALDGES